MSRRLFTGLLALVLLALPARAIAQDEGEMAIPEMEFFTVFQDMVRPSMRQQYEQNTKEMIAAFQAAGVSTEKVSWVAIMSNELGYTYVIPGKGPEDFSAMWGAWLEAMNAVGMDQAMEFQATSAAAMDHAGMSYIALRPDLSYMPETVTINAAEPYRHYYFWYVMPGKEQSFEAVAKEFQQLYQANDIERGWRIYQYITGPDLPLYLVVMKSKDEHHFFMVSDEIDTALGDDADALFAKALSMTRRIDEASGWVRADLSYPVMEVMPSGEE
jgi:hypothetical protein